MREPSALTVGVVWRAHMRVREATHEYALLGHLADFERANPKPTDIRDTAATAHDCLLMAYGEHARETGVFDGD